MLTQGPAGVICSQAGDKPQHLSPPAVQVVDVTGAGDAFSAGVCAGLYQDPQDLLSACRLGLQLAALTLQTEATVHPELGPRWLSAPLQDTEERSP